MYCLRYIKSGTEMTVQSYELDLTKVRQIQQFKYSNTLSAKLERTKMAYEQGFAYEQGSNRYRVILQSGEELYIDSKVDLTKDTRYTVVEF